MEAAKIMKIWVQEAELFPDYRLQRESEAEWPTAYSAFYEVPEQVYQSYNRAREIYLAERRRIREIISRSAAI